MSGLESFDRHQSLEIGFDGKKLVIAIKEGTKPEILAEAQKALEK